MLRRFTATFALFAITSSTVVAQDYRYMLPPETLDPAATSSLYSVRSNQSPVEAVRPVMSGGTVETDLTSLDEFDAALLSCSIAMSTEQPVQEPATNVSEPVVAARPDSKQPATPTEQPRVEVVFVLDTTGSMSGLIAAAKDKIWAIANTIALAEPAPQIKMGLVGYRDRGDAYVTKVTNLTEDLDAVYSSLMDFQAGGGGDAPESVNQALQEAVTQITWSDDDSTYRVIYLVGDAPPHMDYLDDVKYQTTCEAAVKKDILINTIQCGSMSETAPIWKEIASLAEGQYFQIAQDGGQLVRATPFDAKLAELAAKLDGTKLYFGTPEQRAAGFARSENTARFRELSESAISKKEGITFVGGRGAAAPSAPDVTPSALARRAIYNGSAAGKANFLGEQELVDAYSNGIIKLEALSSDELPEELRKLSKEDLEKKLKNQAAERAKIQSEIRELADKRQKFLEAELAKEKDARPELDLKLYGSIKEQAAKKGIEYTAPAPAY